MDKPIINYGEEFIGHISTEVIVKYFKKFSIDHVINGFLFSIFGEDDMPQLKTIKIRDEDKGKNIDTINTLLIFKNGEWVEENYKKVSLEVRKKMYELVLVKLTPKPDDLPIEKYQEFLKIYSEFLEYYNNNLN